MMMFKHGKRRVYYVYEGFLVFPPFYLDANWVRIFFYALFSTNRLILTSAS